MALARVVFALAAQLTTLSCAIPSLSFKSICSTLIGLPMAVKQDRRLHHRDTETQRHRETKKKAQEMDFSTQLSVAVLFLGFSVPLW
jgi:hypothetical protein